MGNSIKHRTCRRILTGAASALALMAAAPIAMGQSDDVRTIEIPAGSLGDVLLEISETYGVNVVASETLLGGKSSEPVSGDLSVADALTQALDETGLRARALASGGYAIEQSEPQETSAEPTPTSTSQAIVEDPDPLVAETVVVQGRFQQSLIDRIPIDPQELPFSLNSLDREFIDRRNFVTPIDVVSLIPNADLGAQNAFGNPGIIVRGFQTPYIVNNKFQNSGVRAGGGRDDAFIDTIEVLKGPASIALGPILPGGIVNLITKSPEADPFFGVEASTDQFGTLDTEFDYNSGALFGSDLIKFRVSGAYRDIQFDADQANREVFAVRPVISLDFGDTTYGQFSLSYVKQDAIPSGGFALFSDGSIPDEFNTDTFFGSEDDSFETEDVLIEGQLSHEFLDNLRLTIRGSRQVTDEETEAANGAYNYTYDDGVPGIGLNNPIVYIYTGYGDISETENTFLDAQLAYNSELWGQRQDLVIGASYYQTDIFSLTDFDANGGIQVPISDIDVPRRFQSARDFGLLIDSLDTVRSVFAELALRPTERLTIIAGARYDEVENESVDGFGDGSEAFGSVERTPVESESNETTFRIGASYKVSSGINVYASLAESFVPQGGTRFDGSQVGPSTGISYEVGFKANAFDGRVNVEAALFDTRRENVSVLDLENSDLPLIRFDTTIGEQRNRGLEFFGTVRPIDGLKVDLSYGFLEVDILEAGDLFNFETAFPKHTANAFVSYEVTNGTFKGLEFGGGPRYVGERESARVNEFKFDDYIVGDAFVSYPINDDMSIALNILNVTDELYLKSAGFGEGLLTGANVLGEPRTFRLTFRGRF